MLKHRSRIKKQNAKMLGSELIVEYKIYIPRGQVNTSFFNVYKIIAETDSFFIVEPVPLIELQIVRNHLAKKRGENEWEFEFVYNASEERTWIAHGIFDPNQIVKAHTESFIKLIQTREEDYQKKIEARKEKMKLKKAKELEAQSEAV